MSSRYSCDISMSITGLYITLLSLTICNALKNAFDHESKLIGSKKFTSDRYLQGEIAPNDTVFYLQIGVRIHEWKALEVALYKYSDPLDASYGQYLTREEVNELAKPHPNALSLLRQWVHNYAQQEPFFSEDSNVFRVLMRVEDVEKLLQTTIHFYQNPNLPNSRSLFRASTRIIVPVNLHPYISYLNINSHPLELKPTSRSSKKSARSRAISTWSPVSVNLNLIHDQYHIPPDLVVRNETNRQGFPAFYDEGYDPKDLELFYRLGLPNETFPKIIHVGSTQSNATLEASLDIQYLTGVARNSTTYAYFMTGSNPYSPEDEPFLEFAQAVLEQDHPPYVISMSYSDDEYHVFAASENYARAFDALLVKMGLRGISVLVASGDDGVSGLYSDFQSPKPRNKCAKAHPQWPASSPYLTTVGGTMMLEPSNISKAHFVPEFFITKEEIVASSQFHAFFTSGGGFSNYYERPQYQANAVQGYLKDHTTQIPHEMNYFNRTSRAYPDISALGVNLSGFVSLKRTRYDGTSASTPVVAAMITLLNDIRLNSGMQPLGFLNPLIYHLHHQAPSAFQDVVIGNNGADGKGRTICEQWFGATTGWDAASGVGTPNFSFISAFIHSLGQKKIFPEHLAETQRVNTFNYLQAIFWVSMIILCLLLVSVSVLLIKRSSSAMYSSLQNPEAMSPLACDSSKSSLSTGEIQSLITDTRAHSEAEC
uniref:subtilisin n=1 Tax=Albugo laibachii Nc14 TaxID=890382 RepID=F0W0Q2_9STRA|nr:tripeptidylpeptidase putative [Albugo laibachii Nc14]|eukprot:CCA14626.1 tripeptidylpeptidase putative [Albugo laibachii Nc14]